MSRINGTARGWNKREKWVLLVSINPGGPNGGSATQYFIGDWNGKEFIPDSEFVNSMGQKHDFWLDFGTDNYASVSFNNLPTRGNKNNYWLAIQLGIC